jgi:hypothetical protein
MSSSNNKTDGSARIVGVCRIVLAFFLLGWFAKSAFFFPYLFKSVFDVPISNAFFPPFFQSNLVSVCAYVAPLSAAACFASDKLKVFQCAAVVLVISAGILCLHQNTYNDATFVISFWAALWLLWFSWCGRQCPAQAAVLASCVVGLMFLGGFVGKLMPRYINGEIIGRIFLEQGGESPLIFLLGAFNEGQTRTALSLIAKFVIFGEGLLALNLVVHRRIFWIASLAVIPLLILFSSWRILSVISGLIGLLVAALILERHVHEN